MDLDFPGETSGVSPYFAPGFALGYAAALAHLWGPEEAEGVARFFAAHDFSDTFAYGISPDHWYPWTRALILGRDPRTQAWRASCSN
jgi:hypothetical protein